MKTLSLFLILALLLILPRSFAADTPPGTPTLLPGGPTPAPVPLGVPPLTPPDAAAGPTIPTGSFDAGRYEVLWTKSPFSVATSEDTATASPDYSFVGFAANIDGVSYASLIEKDNNSQLLISTDKAVKGMTLTSINRNKDGSDIYALVKKDGESLTLKLEQAPVSAVAQQPGAMPNGLPPGVVPPPNMGVPQMVAPGTTMPGFGPPGANRPFPRIHRTPIHLPPMPGQQQQQAAPPPAPAQTH